MECSKQEKRAFDKNPFSVKQISPNKESSLNSLYKG
jgi:YHS domain-containing protein